MREPYMSTGTPTGDQPTTNQRIYNRPTGVPRVCSLTVYGSTACRCSLRYTQCTAGVRPVVYQRCTAGCTARGVPTVYGGTESGRVPTVYHGQCTASVRLWVGCTAVYSVGTARFSILYSSWFRRLVSGWCLPAVLGSPWPCRPGCHPIHCRQTTPPPQAQTVLASQAGQHLLVQSGLLGHPHGKPRLHLGLPYIYNTVRTVRLPVYLNIYNTVRYRTVTLYILIYNTVRYRTVILYITLYITLVTVRLPSI